MAQVITGLDNIPISAASAAYAPTNTADVTAMIDSAVSAKLDASAEVVTAIGTTAVSMVGTFVTSINGDFISAEDARYAIKDRTNRDLTSLAASSSLSAYQQTSAMSAYATTGDLGNYQPTSSMSDYLATSSIGVDSASAVTSIAGSSVGGAQVVTSISTGGYGVSAINDQVINASHMKIGAAAANNTSNIVRLGDESYGAGVFLTGSFGTAYYKVNELQLNRNGTGFIGFNIGNAGSQITATSNAGGKFSAGGTGGNRSYFTAYNASASASIEVTADSAKINLADSGYTSTIYPSSIPYWNAKLDSSSIGTSVDGITGIGGSAIADGGTTYTAGQYIQISGDEISVTGLQPSGDYVSSSDLADYQPTSSMSAYATTGDLSSKLDASASSSFVTSTADCMPLSASSDYYSTSNPSGYITGVDLTPYQTTAGMSAYATTGDLGDYQPTSSMSAYATTGDLSAKLDASASSSFITSTAGLATTGDLTAKLDASASSSFITSTSDCMPLSASSDYYSTSNPAGYITGVDLTPYQTTADMSGYLATSSIGVDTADAITSIAGSAIAGGGGGGGGSQVQSDWLETSTALASYIRNKPAEGNISAGQYVSISASGTTVTIDVTGLQPTGDMSSYVTTGEMSAYATTADISSISAEIGDINTLLQSI